MTPRAPGALVVLRAAWVRLTTSLAPARHRERADAELREELEAHLAMHVADNIRRGMSPDEARRDALLATGGLTQGMERVRERRGIPWLERTAADVRDALRSFAARPGFAIAVVLTLALGIGANAAMFTVVNAVVLHPLPYRNPDRILSLSERVGGEDQGVVDERAYFAWTRARSVAMAVESGASAVLATRDGAREANGLAVTTGYFELFGVRPIVGRSLGADDHRAGAPKVVVLSEQLWRRTFGGDSSMVGRTISLDDAPATVVGVMPAAFTTSTGPAYWIPNTIVRSPPNATYYYMVVARLRDGFDLERARAELAALMPPPTAGGPLASGDFAPRRPAIPVVMTLADRRFGARRTPVLLLFAAVGVLLLIACANLGTLALVRATARQREFAVRRALGASAWRLVRALLTESLLLAGAGGALGMMLAAALVAGFVHLSPDSVGNPERLHLDRFVLLFTSAAAIGSALAFGLVPALTAARSDPQRALCNGSPRATAGARQRLVRRALVVWQLATALVLLTAGGLVARSFWRATAIHTGFRADGLIDVAVRLPASAYPDAAVAPFYDELLARVRALPSVRGAAFGAAAPLGGINSSFSTRDRDGHETPMTYQLNVGPDYFRTIGARLVAGREFDATDRVGDPPTVVVNALLARRLYPDGSAVGKTMAGPNGKSVIVGVVDDVLQMQLETAPVPLVYTNLSPRGATRWMGILVRADGDPSVTERAITQLVQSTDRRLPPPAFERMDEVVARALAPRAFLAVLLGAFAALAALLATVGLYGVLSQTVSGRAREIGIRVALGADARRLLATVVGQGLGLVTAGVVIGLAVSVASVRLMRGLLYETSVYDPWAMAGTTILLVVVGLVASYLPARRATRIDPVTVLRDE